MSGPTQAIRYESQRVRYGLIAQPATPTDLQLELSLDGSTPVAEGNGYSHAQITTAALGQVGGAEARLTVPQQTISATGVVGGGALIGYVLIRDVTEGNASRILDVVEIALNTVASPGLRIDAPGTYTYGPLNLDYNETADTPDA